MRTSPETSRRLCCAVDARNYSALTPADQYDLQADLIDLLGLAAQEARLDRLAWNRQESGDGELALLPPDQSESALIDDFVRELDAALHRHNRVRLPNARLRLRMAVHFGVAFPADNGYAGPAAVVVSRLASSRPLKRALEEMPNADLVVGLSDNVYQDTVAGGLTKTLPQSFIRHRIDDEKYRGLIWIRSLGRPGDDEPAGEADGTDAADEREFPATVVRNQFYGNVEAGVIGVNLGRAGS